VSASREGATAWNADEPGMTVAASTDETTEPTLGTTT
jgi:hypothetical protein